MGFAVLSFGSQRAQAQGSPPGCTGSGLGIVLFTDARDVHIGDTIRYSVTVFNGADTGPVVCDAINIQAQIVTPDGVVHPITLRRTALSNGQADYYENVVSYVARAQDMLPDGTVRATASDTGTILQNDTPSQGGSEQGVNTEIAIPCIGVSAICVGAIGENGLITFTGSVTNCGNNTLLNVTVTNTVNGQRFQVITIPSLARGEVRTFTGSWNPANPCVPSTATIVAQARDELTVRPQTVTSSTSMTCSLTVTPGLVLTKSCPTTPIVPGAQLTYSGSVSNSGNVTLTNIVVLNSQPAANTTVFTLASLAPGATANFTGTYVAPTNCLVAEVTTATANSVCGTPVNDSVETTCPILTTPGLVVTAVCPTTPVMPGAAITYTGTVRNSGNITLNNVVVTSSQPALNTPVFAVASLAPGQTATFTSNVNVPVGACAITSIFSGTGQDACTSVSVTNSVTTVCAVITAPAISVTLSCPTTAVATGGLITYTGTVRNSGDVTLNNISIVNSQNGATPVFTAASLAPGASVNFTAAFTSPTNACSVSSVVTARATDSCSLIGVTNTASATCTLITTPVLEVTQVCPTTPVTPGALLTYTGTVRNAGDITLTNVVVVNSLSGSTVVFTAATLAPGAIANFTGSYLAPTNNCNVASTLTGTATSTCGISVTDTATTSCTILTAPALVVTAVCPTEPIVPGGAITYTGTIRNSGNITLTNVVIVNNQPTGTPVFTVESLAPGAVANFTSNVLVPAGACAVTTLFSGTAQSSCTSVSVTNQVSVTCSIVTAPAVAVTLACPTTAANVGGLVTYTGTVLNTGNVTLTGISVINSRTGTNVVFTVASLAPGATTNFTGSFTAPANVCAVANTVTVRGTDSCSLAGVTNTASATCTLLTTPALDVTQLCPTTPATPGGLVNYTGTVRNTGNIALTNIVIVNNLTGNTPVFSVATLAPGAVLSFSGSYTAPADCNVASTVTGTATSICGVPVTDSASATCPILTAPAIVVSQVCPIISPLPGELLTYSGTVSNAGNITLTNIIVVSDEPASNTVVLVVASLAPGAVTNFTGSYQVPLNCCIVSSTVRATGQDCRGTTVTDTATRTCTVRTVPQLVVTKVCEPGPLNPGDLLTYSGTVSNAGNITLINVTVVNNQTPGVPALGPITLAPGESVSYTHSYVIPPDFCGTDTVTARGTDICTLVPVTHQINVNCPITAAPRIAITKNCPVAPTVPGGVFTYTGTVSNPGTVTLVNVYVVNSRPTNSTPVIGPITLAPGQSVNFTASYTAQSCCCYILDTLTATGRDRCFNSNVTATATSACPLLSSPAVALVQNCPTTLLPGDLYSFSGFVTNTGNAVLTNVMVFGPQGTNTVLLGPIELAPGEIEFYSGSYTVPAGACSVAVTVRGLDACNGSVATNVTRCLITTAPALEVAVDCPTTAVAPGGTLVYTGSIQNVGDITLTNVVVLSDSPAVNTVVFTVPTLAPGATADFTSSRVAPTNVCSVATVFRGTARDVCGVQSITNSTTVTCSITTTPAIAVTETCPTGPVTIGSQVTFTGTVRNSGNITLTNIMVFSSGNGGAAVLGPITLAPGATAGFTGSYTATSVTASNTVNATGMDLCSGDTVAASANCAGPLGPTTPVAIQSGTVLPNGNYTLSFLTQLGRSYTVQYKDSISTSTWTNLQTVTGTGNVETVQDVDADIRPMRMYRVISPQ